MTTPEQDPDVPLFASPGGVAGRATTPVPSGGAAPPAQPPVTAQTPAQPGPWGPPTTQHEPLWSAGAPVRAARPEPAPQERWDEPSAEPSHPLSAGTLGHPPAPPSAYPPAHPPTPAPTRARRPRRALSAAWAVPLVLLALVAGLVGGVLGAQLTQDDHLADAGLPASVPQATPGASADPAAVGGTASVASIAATVLPSVVSIEASADSGVATGSGFVLRQDGYLLTNSHVVAGADGKDGELVVTFADGRELPATIVGRTAEYDLAVIKVDAEGLVPLALGDSSTVRVGDPVVAIGAPLGLAGTVTTGIVSAMNRPVSAGDETDTAFINAIQTDAAINPGNSGGPLVDENGKVVGINSAIAQPPGQSMAGGSIGLGFAIPADQARRTASQLIETGRATYPIIGVLLDSQYSGEGVQVSSVDQDGQAAVTAGGPADRAGVRPGDVIVAIDGRPMTDPDELIVAIRAHEPGDVVELTLRVGDEERVVRVELDESP
jgi:putative serine protease PepD